MAVFYANKKTKVLHNSKREDACRASEIKASNRQSFDDKETAKAAGYRLCRICFKGNERI